jgi:hypothetical protein
LLDSLIKSEMGCINPINLDLLGPFRFWENPINLRSIKVKNATVIKIIRIVKTVGVIIIKWKFFFLARF